MGSEEYISDVEAATRLGVSRQTVWRWVKSGRLSGSLRPVTLMRFRVASSSLATARNAVCVWCGESFESQRPTRAKFCCKEHSIRWFDRKAAARKNKK
jgi:excisionase family DNA binding protein